MYRAGKGPMQNVCTGAITARTGRSAASKPVSAQFIHVIWVKSRDLLD
jgi:hypothetical protein